MKEPKYKAGDKVWYTFAGNYIEEVMVTAVKCGDFGWLYDLEGNGVQYKGMSERQIAPTEEAARQHIIDNIIVTRL